MSFSATGPSGCGPITSNPRGSQLTGQGSPIGDPDLGGWPSFSPPHPSSTTFPGSKCSLQSLSSDVTLLSTVLHARRMNTLLQTVQFPLQGSFIQFPRSLGPVPHGLQRGNTSVRMHLVSFPLLRLTISSRYTNSICLVFTLFLTEFHKNIDV